MGEERGEERDSLAQVAETEQVKIQGAKPLGLVILSWSCALVSVVACSSGGVWFALLTETPPILRAGWRLIMTALLQVPGFVIQYQLLRTEADSQVRDRFCSPRVCGSLLVSGTALAVHFASWSISIELTSLSHSLLFVCTTPIMVVLYNTLVCREPTWVEYFGTAISFAAAVVLANDAATSNKTIVAGDHENSPSLFGDMIAALGAAAMGAYLIYGSSLRSWMPVWLYVFPVTLTSSLWCFLVSMSVEPVHWNSISHSSEDASFVFGLFTSVERFAYVMGAALTAGMLGHTLTNFALVYISPLAISVLFLFEPIVGSAIGYLVGVETTPPTVTTMVASVPLLIGAGMVILGSRTSYIYTNFCCHPRCRRSYDHLSLDTPT